ncbi:MAG: glycosyltransferase family 4 protein [Pyrinomonadaceae bacterium]
MNVCHICDSSLEGDYFRNMALGLTRKGVRVSLIELGPGTAPTWLGYVPGIKYLSLKARGKTQYPLALLRLSRFLRQEKVDILHTHLFFSGLLGVLVKRLYRKPVVAVMRHHTGVVRMLGSRIHVAADKWMAENADRVLTVSEAARRYMIETDGIDRSDIEVVHLGFDFEKLSSNEDDRNRIRREFGIADEDFVIGYVANFARGKGHIQLIDGFAKILTEIPKAKLFFAGRGNRDAVNAVADRFSPGQIIFAGWRTDVAACLNAMDLFVQPSLSEAFSQVLIEAMGVGLPVIATDVGGAAEVIDNGVNGILIEPDNVQAISDQTIWLFSDERLRTNLAAAGQVSVRKKFTAEQMVDRQFALYRDWLA